MLKISCVPMSVGLYVASLALGSGAFITAPYLLAKRPAAHTKSSQCRVIFSTVVSSKNMGPGFYRRKASNIRSLPISDRSLRSLQARLSSTFQQLETAQQQQNQPRRRQLGKQASRLVSQLNRYCFK
ncbi:hypothetical protein IQ266_21040 [filamentous cyanobacterium LEGE 11480]|uniref:Uncharacterized protein n=1 Tax=Romeriopsis navalis LEGE 11480 TaxID=2777977 RepID=A0A928VTE2_9CYAN|nr:hypothetical protein [Romeriopsis navalis]MBE9032230.1 hypothetical protein [Romeriopsis navalis LEGE 11480]